jgi:hypothetical protein
VIGRRASNPAVRLTLTPLSDKAPILPNRLACAGRAATDRLRADCPLRHRSPLALELVPVRPRPDRRRHTRRHRPRRHHAIAALSSPWIPIRQAATRTVGSGTPDQDSTGMGSAPRQRHLHRARRPALRT